MGTTISNTQDIEHLLYLLDDNDQEVVDIVTKKIISFGQEVIPYLHEKLLYGENKTRDEKIIFICQEISKGNIVNGFKNHFHASFEYKDFYKLNYWISKVEIDDLEMEDYEQMLTPIEKLLTIEISPQSSLSNKISILSKVLYEHFHFEFLPSNYSNTKEYLLWNVLKRKTGNSYSLALLYLLFSKYINLPIVPCTISNIILLTVLPEDIYDNYNLEVNTTFPETDLSIFIDPSVGLALNLKQVKKFVFQTMPADEVKKSTVKILSPMAFLDHYLRELKNSYNTTKQIEKKQIVSEMISTL